MTNTNITDPIKRYSLYVLKLEQGKYYVGVTAKTPEERFRQHKAGFAGARWTKKYKPVEIFDQKDLGEVEYTHAEAYEAKVVREYIKKYGLNNVRGGDLTDPEDYVKRFGFPFTKTDWETISVVTLLLLVILGLTLKIYI